MASHSSALPITPNATSQQFLLCKICRQAVLLETCKIDEQGQPVHEQCYVDRVK